MKRSNTIYTKSIMYINMCHMNTPVFVNNCKFRIVSISFLNLYIKHFYNRHKMRHNFLKIPNWPFFQSFSKNGMISIGTHSRYYIYSIIHTYILFKKKSYKLWNNHSWMCIINLYNCIIRQIIKITSLCNSFVNNKLRCITHHKILLVNTQKLPLIITIIRVKKQRKISLYIVFIKKYTVFLNHTLIYRLNIKQFKSIALIVISCNINFIHN